MKIKEEKETARPNRNINSKEKQDNRRKKIEEKVHSLSNRRLERLVQRSSSQQMNPWNNVSKLKYLLNLLEILQRFLFSFFYYISFMFNFDERYFYHFNQLFTA